MMTIHVTFIALNCTETVLLLLRCGWHCCCCCCCCCHSSCDNNILCRIAHTYLWGYFKKYILYGGFFFLLLPFKRGKSTETFISTNFISNFIVTMWFHCFLNNFILTFISNVIPKFLWLLRWSLVTMLKIMNIS